MAHPDQKIINHGLASLEAMAAQAGQLGCRLFTLCTGTLDPVDQWRYHPGNQSPQAWDNLLVSMGKALRIAEKYNIFLGIEPELANIIDSPANARRLIDLMGSKRIKVIFDAANLFEKVHLDEQQRIIANAIDLLRDDIAIAHAKDRLADGSFAPAGTGILDYRFYIAQLMRIGFKGSIITHGLTETDAGRVAVFLADILSTL